MDPEKEYSCQKGLLVFNRAQIHNQSLAAIVYRGLSSILHIKENLQTELPSLLHCVPPFSPKHIKKFLESILTNGLRPASSNRNCAAISSFAYLPTNQSSSIRPNQDAHC